MSTTAHSLHRELPHANYELMSMKEVATFVRVKEVATFVRVPEATLRYWRHLGTLLGGAALILCGLYAHVSGTTRRMFIMLGAATGLLASAWTLVMPVLAITVIVVNARASPQHEEAPKEL